MCVWIEDADAIDMESKALNMVYINTRVKSFLNGKNTLGIAGVKGQGKTFLLKVKRKKAQGSNKSCQKQSIVCLPRNKMVDTIDSSLIINKQLYKFFNDYNNWVKAWKLSFAITIINSEYFCNLYEEIDFMKMKNITKEMIRMENRWSSPIKVLTKIFRLSRKEINELYVDLNELLMLLERVQSGVYFFVDKVDQAFTIDIHRIYGDTDMSRGARNASYWQYSQYALANAAYDLFSNINNHIKVYYTIREEALIDSHKIAPNNKRNIEAYLMILKYSKIDLHNMFKLYVESEDDINLLDAKIKRTNQEKAFIGMDFIKHGYIDNIDEGLFDYIYRHSLKRPYDIMRICRQLYFLDNEDKRSLRQIRGTVNNASKDILKAYIKELSPFLPCEYEDIKNVLHGINTNVFNIEYMKIVCERYNTFYEGFTKCNRNFVECNNPKPFSLLYNLGLLGVLKQSHTNRSIYIEFENIGESVFNFETQTIPKSELFFLHPCLGDIVRELRNQKGLNYQPNDIFVTGDLCEYNNARFAELEQFILEKVDELKGEKIFVSSTIHDLSEERDKICGYLLDRGLYPIMSETPYFDLSNVQLSHSHDYCIEQLLGCKNLIFILGKKYGGIYSGEKYKKYAEEICKLSKNKIERPSISLMELYMARKNGLRCYLFVSEEIELGKRKYDKEKENSTDIDTMVFIELNFINHFREEEEKAIKGNWISVYQNNNELIKRISNLMFSTAPISTKL